MFDDIQKQPEDIFEGTEIAAPPPPPEISIPSDMGSGAPSVSSGAVMEEVGGGLSWKPFAIGAGVLALVGGAAWAAWAIMSGTEPPTPGVPNVTESVSEEVNEAPVPTGEAEDAKGGASAPRATDSAPKSAEESVAPTDRDRDGLSDADELQIGTSPTASDTDADGLFDKEESATYGTDPLDPDTDGDGYLDGSEVKNGYNPKGEGKLFGGAE